MDALHPSYPSYPPHAPQAWGFQPPPQAATGWTADAWRQAPAPVASAGRAASWWGWLAGVVAGFGWALPRLGRFGPLGLISSTVVVVACGWYGGKAVEAVQALLRGSWRAVAQVGAWLAGARLGAAVVAGMRQPGPLLVAATIWFGSWVAAKLLDACWPSDR